MCYMVVNARNYSNKHTQLSSNIRETKMSIVLFPEGFLRGAKGRRFLSPDFAEVFLAHGASRQDKIIVSEKQAAGAPFTSLLGCSTVSVS